MRKLQSLLAVPYKGEGAPKKRIYFGQLLVGDSKLACGSHLAVSPAGLQVTTIMGWSTKKIDNLEFAKEVANAVLIQAELNEVALDYTPNGDQFVSRKEGRENILEFEGDKSSYLRLPDSEADSFLVSFRECEEGDQTAEVATRAGMMPSHVLTLSVDSSMPGEFLDEGFWKQLGTNLFMGLSEPDPERGRAGHPDLKIAVVFGCDGTYQVIPENLMITVFSHM